MAGDDRVTQLLPVPGQRAALPSENQAVQREARLRLRNSGYYELRLVSCDFHQGVLTLQGSVSSFYLKQVAQTLIRTLDGVGELDNRLEVVTPLGQYPEVPCARLSRNGMPLDSCVTTGTRATDRLPVFRD